MGWSIEQHAGDDLPRPVLTAILRASPVGIVAARPLAGANGIEDFAVFLANDAAEAWMSPAGEADRRLSELFPHFVGSGILGRLVRVAHEGSGDRFELAVRRNGEDRHCIVTAVREGGDLILTLADVSELAAAGADLAREHEALARTNAELLRQQEDLRATSESLELARQALGAEIQRRAALEARLRQLAEIDALSGLANRRHFLEVAETELRRSRRYGTPLSLLMLDIDHFKAINDSHGHAAGDEIIRAVADICRDGCRIGLDMAGRLGGEEFAILMPQTPLAGAAEVGERLRERISRHIVSFERRQMAMTASIGIAERLADDVTLSTILRRADQALYEAKRAGRNRIALRAA